jgi:hypothetical protein
LSVTRPYLWGVRAPRGVRVESVGVGRRQGKGWGVKVDLCKGVR